MRWSAENFYDPDIVEASARWNVPVPLIKAVIGVESGFNPQAINKQDPGWAWGLMQMIPATATGLGYTGRMDTLLTDPGLAIDLGVQLLRQNLARSGGVVADSVSAYNGGFRPQLGFGKPLASGQYGNQAYVVKVLDAYRYFGGVVGPGIGGAPGSGASFPGGGGGGDDSLEPLEAPMSQLSAFASARATRDRIEEAAAFLGPVFWKWYAFHSEDKVITVKLLFISKTIRVRDVRPVFVLIFGPPPVGGSA